MGTEALTYVLENGEPWLQYAARVHLLHESQETLTDVRSRALADPKIAAYLTDVADYHGTLVTNHKNPDLPIHKLLFLLDLGFDTDVPEIQTAIDAIMANKDANGVYRSLTNIPTHFGGSGEDSFGWCLCDAPLLLYALVTAGVDYEKHIKRGVGHLVSLHRDNGFPCAVSPEFGAFRGPGRKGDPCPYASLIMVRLLSAIPEYGDSEALASTAQSLLTLWESSAERHPYMFYMGTDFRKLKAPAMWYDIVSVTETLSRVACVRADARFQDMVSIIRSNQDSNGLCTPEAVYLKFKDWDFGQKKVPSPYLTYLCYRLLKQAEA